MTKFLLAISLLAVILNPLALGEEDSSSERPILSVGLTGLYPRPEEIDEGSETVFTFKKIPIKGPMIKIEKKPYVKTRPQKEKRALERKLSEKEIRTLEEALYEDATNEVLRDLGYIE